MGENIRRSGDGQGDCHCRRRLSGQRDQGQAAGKNRATGTPGNTTRQRGVDPSGVEMDHGITGSADRSPENLSQQEGD